MLTGPKVTDSHLKALEKEDNDYVIDISHMLRDVAHLRSTKKLKKGIEAILTREGEKIAQFMRDYAPKKTGKLKKSIKVGKPELKNKEFTISIGPDVGYGKYLEYGTGKFNTRRSGKPYVIRAKPGKVLAFKGKNGKMVFTKQVIHPGIKPKPFIKPALEEYADGLEEAIQEEIHRIIINDPSKKPETKLKPRGRR